MDKGLKLILFLFMLPLAVATGSWQEADKRKADVGLPHGVSSRRHT